MATTGTDQPSESERVLHIRFERSDSDRIEETLRAIDAGETPEPYFECTFHDSDQLHQVTRPKNLQSCFRTIALEEPIASVRLPVSSDATSDRSTETCRNSKNSA